MKKAVGIDIGGTNTHFSLVDESGKALKQVSAPTPRSKSPSETVRKIFIKAKELGVLDTAGRVGCGVPAIIHPANGYVDFAPNLGWRKFSMARAVPAALGIKKIIFENDANCAAWGIYRRSKKKVHSLAVLTLGTGVGGGLIIDGKLLSNPEISAFEVGHMAIDPSGRKCGCGSRGCIETFCGARHMNEWAREYWKGTKFSGKKLTPLEIDREARNGAAWAKKVWEKYGEYLAIAVGNLVNLFALEEVVFTGGIASGFDLFGESLRGNVGKHTMYPYLKKLRMRSVAWNEYIGSIGAGLLALN